MVRASLSTKPTSPSLLPSLSSSSHPLSIGSLILPTEPSPSIFLLRSDRVIHGGQGDTPGAHRRREFRPPPSPLLRLLLDRLVRPRLLLRWVAEANPRCRRPARRPVVEPGVWRGADEGAWVVGAGGQAAVECLHPPLQAPPARRRMEGSVGEVPVRPLKLRSQLRRGPRGVPRGGVHCLPRLLHPVRRPAGIGLVAHRSPTLRPSPAYGGVSGDRLVCAR